MPRALLLLLLFLFPAFGLIDAASEKHAARKPLADPGLELLLQGRRLSEHENKYEAALVRYRKAAEIFLRKKDWKNYVETLNGMVRTYTDLARYGEAEKYLKEALDLSLKHLGERHPGTAYTYFCAAYLKSRSEAPDEALVYGQKALAVYTETLGKESPEVGMALFQIGFTYVQKRDLDKAIEYCGKSATIRKKALGENDSYVAAAYNMLGWAYGRKGYYGKLLDYGTRSLEIRKKLYGENHRTVAVSYANLTYAYIIRRDYEKQLEYHQKELAIHRNIFGEQHPKTAETYYSMGFAYMEKGDFTRQIEHTGKALEIYKKLYGADSPDLFYPYFYLGSAYLKVDAPDQALACYKNAYRVKGKTFGARDPDMVAAYAALAHYYEEKNETERALFYAHKALGILHKGNERRPLIAEMRNLQGEYFLRIGRPQRAAEAFQRGLIAVSEDFNSLRFEDNPNPETSNSKYVLLSLLANKAEALRRSAAASKETKSLKTALHTYKAAMRLADRLRFGLTEEEFMKKIMAKHSSLYEDAVETAHCLYERTSEEVYLHAAFEISERNKASLLQKALADTRAKKFVHVPKDLLDREKEIKLGIEYYENALQEEENDDNVEMVKEFKKRLSSLHALAKKFEKEYPQYYALKYDTEPASVEKLQSSLEKNTALVEYLVGERNLYVFLLSKNGLKLVKTAKPENLAERVQQLQRHVLSRDFEGYTREAHRLYREVFEPLRAHLNTLNPKPTRLTVVPDGPLWYLNFETLLSRPSQTRDYAKQAYLLKDYSFGYAYSATLCYGNPKVFNYGPASEKQCLAFSFSGGGDNQKHEELPGSLTELRAVSKILKGQFLRGREANEAAFKQLAPNHTVLHLALHGEVDDRRPERSALYFPTVSDKNDKQKASLEDGILYASELYDMNLNAELAVLSACNTGDGRLVKGEGIVSLGRAFAYAGCKSLVMSLWEVSDATAPELMEHFYKNLKQGLPKDEALRKAKLAYLALADNLSANPFYWGGFVLLGDSAPLPLEKPQAPQRADFRLAETLVLLFSLFCVAYYRMYGKKYILF